MPNLNLSGAENIRIANRDALAIRAGNQNIWEVTEPFVEYSIFGSESPNENYTAPYNEGADLHTNGWTANAFYTYGREYENSKIVGARYWVPAGSSMIGESIKISIYQSPAGSIDTWPSYDVSAIMNGLVLNEALTTFPSGTLVEGWNDLRFNTHIPLIHYAYFVIGVSVGDGSKYIFSEPPTADRRQSNGKGRLMLSRNAVGDARGFFMTQGDSYRSPGHYGIDVTIQVPISESIFYHSVWANTEPHIDWYNVYSGLGANGWTASNFYITNTGVEQEGWTLIGARLWVPAASHDTIGIEGMSAQCGYYVKSTPSLINTTDDTPTSVINGIIANTQPAITLVRGWNEVLFSAPINLPLGTGVAIGWKIANGDYYVAAGLEDPAQQSFDLSPLWLASSVNDTSIRRGEYQGSGAADWSYRNNHYGADIIVKEP